MAIQKLSSVTRVGLDLAKRVFQVHAVEANGEIVVARKLARGIDTGGPIGCMVLTVLGMVAEMELGFIRERQRAGIAAAKAKGVYKGRLVTFDHPKIIALRKEGIRATEIARVVGCTALAQRLVRAACRRLPRHESAWNP